MMKNWELLHEIWQGSCEGVGRQRMSCAPCHISLTPQQRVHNTSICRSVHLVHICNLFAPWRQMQRGPLGPTTCTALCVLLCTAHVLPTYRPCTVHVPLIHLSMYCSHTARVPLQVFRYDRIWWLHRLDLDVPRAVARLGLLPK